MSEGTIFSFTTAFASDTNYRRGGRNAIITPFIPCPEADGTRAKGDAEDVIERRGRVPAKEVFSRPDVAALLPVQLLYLRSDCLSGLTRL